MLGPSRWLCNGNALLRKACRVWELFHLNSSKTSSAHMVRECLLWTLIQPTSILFSSFFSSISPLLAFSAREWTFHFPSRSCQTLLCCLLIHLLSSKTLESAHILKKEDHPKLSSAVRVLRWGWEGSERMWSKRACRDHSAVGKQELPDTAASQQPCLACSPLGVACDGNKLFSGNQAGKGSSPYFVLR